jgi:secreted protein with Ig-like and vWFA domain
MTHFEHDTNDHGDAIDADQARLTAYALGELPESERAEVEARLANDEAAREQVAEIQAFARELAQGFAAESGASLESAQRATVLAGRAPTIFSHRVRVALACAATVTLAAAGIYYSQPNSRGRQFLELDSASIEPSTRPNIELASRDALPELREIGYLGAPVASHAPARHLAARLRGNDELLRQYEKTKSTAPADVKREQVESIVDDVVELEIVDGTDGALNTESYAPIEENPFRRVSDESLSTFSIDVDTASYSNVRRMLNEGRLPPPSAVRIEEFINYFHYQYPQPEAGQPFSISTEVARCPWKPEHQLVLIGLQGKAVNAEQRKPANLVFLLDVSGSMNSPDKLPLLVQSMQLLTEHLDHRDRVAIVVYAGASGLVLPSTSGFEQATIRAALAQLQAGGSTNGGAGIELAYKTAQESFLTEGNNRVILATDGDFNVGITDRGSLLTLIEEKRKSGVFLSVLGFGTGNTKDDTMELLADKGNGNYAYIDTLDEAKKVLGDQVGGTLEVIAKDVKIQVEFNPATVEAFRLIGYENRILAHQDFNDDTKDAGEIGAGHSVTALYEIVPKGVAIDLPNVDPKRYAPETERLGGATFSGELMYVKLRHKAPDADNSKLIEMPLRTSDAEFRSASENLRFAASVASFAMLLRRSAHAGNLSFEKVIAFAQEARSFDPGGYRAAFLGLVEKASEMKLPAETLDVLRQHGYLGGDDKK